MSPWPTALKATFTFAVVLVVLSLLTGCQTPRTRDVVVPRIEERRIEIPDSLLSCMPEPIASRGWATQRDVALFMVRLAEAGEDCRTKLAAVRRLIESQ